jgi:glutamate--cysteine ligase
MSLSYDDLFHPFFHAMKPRTEWRIGAEAEKIGVDTGSAAAVPYEGTRGIVAVLRGLEKVGYRPVVEVPGGPLIALEHAGGSVTLEPGGQLELSGAPLDDVHAVLSEMRAHLADLGPISSALGLSWLGVGFHPFARQADLPWVPKLRYAIMREYLPTRASRPLDMMRRTATVQANFDYASEEDAMRKLRVALRISPIVTAMVANSPFFEGRVTGDKSERAHVWLAVDPDRQGLLPAVWSERATIRDYVEWALDVPMFLLKRSGRVVRNTGQTFRAFMKDGFEGEVADLHDWEMHLNTLFPEVRLKHTLEVRGGDSLPMKYAMAIPALWTGILYDEKALSDVEALSASYRYEEMQALRPEIARKALGAMFRNAPVAEVARTLLGIATEGLVRRARRSADGADESIHLAGLARLTERGLCPADELMDGLPADPIEQRRAIIERTRVAP